MYKPPGTRVHLKVNIQTTRDNDAPQGIYTNHQGQGCTSRYIQTTRDKGMIRVHLKVYLQTTRDKSAPQGKYAKHQGLSRSVNCKLFCLGL